jgi:alanine racemase
MATTRTESAILEVDLPAIAANWRKLRDLHGGDTAGVVKADAYGLGAARVAPALHAAGCRHFFVAHLSEALALRPLLPDAMLAALNGLPAGAEQEFAHHGIDPVLGSLDEVARWAAFARRLGRRLPALLHIDTGMNRLGLDRRELATLQQHHALLDGIALRYILTHLVSSEVAGDPLNRAQLERFNAACARLPPAPRTVANSSAIFLGPNWRSDLARPGAALYGINPTPGQPNPMRATAHLRARVLQIREVQPGESVGYNATWRAPAPRRIATAGIGYADGWKRALSGRGHALFDGSPAPLVGRVSMDLTTYDVTDFSTIAAGDWLDLIGPGLAVDTVADWAGTNGYEILTSLAGRIARVYTE